MGGPCGPGHTCGSAAERTHSNLPRIEVPCGTSRSLNGQGACGPKTHISEALHHRHGDVTSIKRRGVSKPPHGHRGNRQRSIPWQTGRDHGIFKDGPNAPQDPGAGSSPSAPAPWTVRRQVLACVLGQAGFFWSSERSCVLSRFSRV